MVRNWVLMALTALASAALTMSAFLAHAPDRIVPGLPVSLHSAAGPALTSALIVIAGLLVVCSLLRPHRIVRLVTGISLGGALLLVLLSAAHGAATLAVAAPPAARTSLGAGFWLALAAIGLALVDFAQQVRLSPLRRVAAVMLAVAALVGMAFAGVFDGLSLAQEYHARADVFAAEFRRHLLLVLSSAVISGAVGLPLGVLAFRKAAFGGRLFSVLGIVQTIPSIALFALLIGPLSALGEALPWLRQAGISGIGLAPALIALVLYSLLPLVRNTVAGLNDVPAAVVDAARGNGMRDSQIMRQVMLPLALPVIMSGFRIVVIQTVGLTVVAALIGAGGLGSFVFQGLGQNAIDLVMLGVIPTIGLALVCDAIFAFAGSQLKGAR